MIRYFFSTVFLCITSILLYSQPGSESQKSFIRLTDTVIRTEVKDQSHSPTCWVFGTNSLFESDLIKKYDLKLDLSEMFIARYAYIDKLKTWLTTKGKTYFAGGGQFHDVIRVVNNYGMVPEQAYRGIPNSRGSHDHTKLDTSMQRLGHKFLRAGKTNLSTTDMQQVNDTLDKYLGKVPATFWYQIEQYTPKSFAQKLIHFENVIGAGNEYSVTDYPFTVIRLADLYLMYAEATNQAMGPQADAIELVNKVRRRGNLPNLAPAKTADKAAFFAAIEQERIVELVAEGHRGFDLRRWRAIEKVWGPPGSAGVWRIDTHGANQQRYYQNTADREYQQNYIFRIPPGERDRNPNLTQNIPHR